MAVTSRSHAPAHDVLRKGTSFGRWLRGALERCGKSVSEVCQETELSPALLRAFLNDCQTPDGRPRLPSPDAVQRLAVATDAFADEALRLLSYPVPAEPEAPGPLGSLSPSAQAALARAVGSIVASHIVELPVVRQIAAGAQYLPLDGIPERYPVLRAMVAEEAFPSELFAVRVDGYCVPEAFLRDGDWLICRRGRDARPEDTVIVRRDGRAAAALFAGSRANDVLGVVLARIGSLR